MLFYLHYKFAVANWIPASAGMTHKKNPTPRKTKHAIKEKIPENRHTAELRYPVDAKHQLVCS